MRSAKQLVFTWDSDSAIFLKNRELGLNRAAGGGLMAEPPMQCEAVGGNRDHLLSWKEPVSRGFFFS